MGKNLIALSVALLAALIGAAAKWYFDISIARQKNTFDLHKELHSADLLEARKWAWRFIQDNPNASFQDTWMGRKYAQEAWHLWQVTQYFHRVAAAWKSEYIARHLGFRLFGEPLVWWYVIVFRDNLEQENRQAFSAISDLYDSLESGTRKNPRLAENWAQWHKAAQEDAHRAKRTLRLAR